MKDLIKQAQEKGLTRFDRLEIANEFIKIIASHGREFFKTGNQIAYMKIKAGHVYWVDDYTHAEIYLSYKYWTKGFTHGGTLRALVQALRLYILGRRDFPINHLGPWPQNMCDGDLWGYGESMEQVRKQALNLIKK